MDLMTPEEVTRKLLQSIADQIGAADKGEAAAEANDGDPEDDEDDALLTACQSMWNAYSTLMKVGFDRDQAFQLLTAFFGFGE